MNGRLDAIGMVVADMARSLAFYRRLGLDVPPDADGEPHVEYTLPGGLRLLWDTEETIRSFDPSWTAPRGGIAWDWLLCATRRPPSIASTRS
jgi:catechol 2,3-dioxygenase-like lactoylglutathione lyase family enzyme